MKIIYWINVVVSGIFMFFVILLGATHGIAETPEISGIVYPEFFMIIPAWLIGVMVGLYIYKIEKSEGGKRFFFLLLSIILTWTSPSGMEIARMLF
ncbi:hypothetical protein H0266_14810 [Halobacillus locisalis]|uniref:Uncharacterized protein n=1 Tax=Halobacillus locisalis TaxID=220753 RepID=A0A838CWL4_9BACI|nr:hypothetical protein [Halobacillus locisalis]MBA2176165.1 hypothetical protein [Halobacillus locisalis]